MSEVSTAAAAFEQAFLKKGLPKNLPKGKHSPIPGVSPAPSQKKESKNAKEVKGVTPSAASALPAKKTEVKDPTTSIPASYNSSAMKEPKEGHDFDLRVQPSELKT
mmetsp:Transcript_6784/g.10919  ORF Transcript_6784/g.10919 Transcript_6784/m.10919 type:complete len:106 (+) Transcript_6784:1859-2176(+)